MDGHPHAQDPPSLPGTVALVGGGAWSPGCTFDADLLARSGGEDVLVVPTAAAYEHPERVVAQAGEWFEPLGGRVEGLMVLSRPDAQDSGAADAMRRARFIYLSRGSPMHLRSVLKGSAVWDALVEAWRNGAVVAGSAEAAMVLTDPMVDARGGGLTVGLGLVANLAVVPVVPHVGHDDDVHDDDVHDDKLHRSVRLAPHGVPVAGIPERTALIRSGDGRWSEAGVGRIEVFMDGARAAGGLDVLPKASDA